jgi:hypothetical protein
MTWTIVINRWHPPTLNELTRGKLRARIRLGKSARNMIAVHALLAGVEPAEGKRRVTLHLALGPGRRGADVDAYLKALLDGLKDCRAIRDDSHHWCEIAPIRYARAVIDSTTILLEDML